MQEMLILTIWFTEIWCEQLLIQRMLSTVLYKGNPPIDAAAMHFMGGKQGDILQLPGGKYLDPCTNLSVFRISSIIAWFMPCWVQH